MHTYRSNRLAVLLFLVGAFCVCPAVRKAEAAAHCPPLDSIIGANDNETPLPEEATMSIALFVSGHVGQLSHDPDAVVVERRCTFEMLVRGVDARRERLTLSVLGAPSDAKFDDQTGILRFTPDKSETTRTMRVVARAGERQVDRLIIVRFEENQLPRVEPQMVELYVGDPDGTHLDVDDPDEGGVVDDDKEDAETVLAATGLPPGVVLKGTQLVATAEAKPGTYQVHVISRDHRGESDAMVTIMLGVKEKWLSGLVPAVGVATQRTTSARGLGWLVGPVFELGLVAWGRSAHPGNPTMAVPSGPSHGRILARGELLTSVASDVITGFAYAFGFELAFEREPQRRFLVPLYGVEFGGIRQENVGHHFHTTPHISAYLYTREQLTIQSRVGYRILPGALAESGFHAALTISFSDW